MPFSQATITSVAPPQTRGTQIYLSWASSSPVDTWFQVYVNQQLAWRGRRLSCWIPTPRGPARIDIGTVAAGEEETSFAASLPASPNRRVKLTWQSGSYQGLDLAGFYVYGSTSPGGPISYTTPLATITAYPGGFVIDGFGLGGFGSGGFGQAPGTYTWTSQPLAAGSWSFAVVPFDTAGNKGIPQTTTLTVAAPPLAPGAPTPHLTYQLQGFGFGGFGGGAGFGDGNFGQSSFGDGAVGFGESAVVLTWNPSPS